MLYTSSRPALYNLYVHKVSRFRRETLHGRLKKRLLPSENDRVLKNGLSASKPDYFSHSGPQGAEGGHYEEVGLGRAKTRSIAFYKHF
jgi:hypothetical protein